MAKFILQCKCGNTDLEYLGDELSLFTCKKCNRDYDIDFDLFELIREIKYITYEEMQEKIINPGYEGEEKYR